MLSTSHIGEDEHTEDAPRIEGNQVNSPILAEDQNIKLELQADARDINALEYEVDA